MKSIWALGALFCILPFHANAIQTTFDNTTATTTDFIVDWSDGTIKDWNFAAPPTGDWLYWADRTSSPISFLNFFFRAIPDRYFGLTWQDPTPTAHTLDHYTIWSPDHVTVVAQTSSSITFHLDRNGTAIPEPDTATILALMLAGLISLGLIRHKLLKKPRTYR